MVALRSAPIIALISLNIRLLKVGTKSEQLEENEPPASGLRFTLPNYGYFRDGANLSVELIEGDFACALPSREYLQNSYGLS